jgi:hypothetical protein
MLAILSTHSHGEYRHCEPEASSAVDAASTILGRGGGMGTAASADCEEGAGTAACAREKGADTAACAGSGNNPRRIVSSGAPICSADAGTAAGAGCGEGTGFAASARELNAALSFQQRSRPYQ